APQFIESRQEEINQLCKEIFTEESSKAKAASRNGSWCPTDDELLAKAFAAANGDKLKGLFNGDISPYRSQSEADMGLCSMLVFWVADEAQLDRLFRRSALYRDKWDEKHGGGTYGQRTIERAFRNRTDQYNGSFASEHLTERSKHDEKETSRIGE